MSRIDDLKRQNPQLNVNLIDLIAEADPSDSYKYLGFLIKMLKENSSNNNMNILRHIFGEENILALKKFEDHSKANRVKVKDIGLFNSFKQIKDEVVQAEEILRVKEMEKQTKIIHKDDDWLVLIPLSYEASKLYGNGTKWCTTQEKYWNQYIPDYKLIYIINRKDDKIKFAISSKVANTLVEGWQSNDNPISPFLIPIPPEIFILITSELRDATPIQRMTEYKGINSRVSQMERSMNDLRTYQSPYYSGHTISNGFYDDDFTIDADHLRSFTEINRVSNEISDIIDPEDILEIFNRLKLR